MTVIQKISYGSILIIAIATASASLVAQFKLERQLDHVYTILSK